VTAAGRVAYGPVTAGDVPGLFDANFHHGRAHPLAHGRTDELPYVKNQERLTFARVGVTDPRSLADYLAHDGYRGLAAALKLEPAAIVESVTASGLRGRAARHSRRIKWKTVLGAAATKSTSSATPMRAIRAHFPTAW